MCKQCAKNMSEQVLALPTLSMVQWCVCKAALGTFYMSICIHTIHTYIHKTHKWKYCYYYSVWHGGKPMGFGIRPSWNQTHQLFHFLYSELGHANFCEPHFSHLSSILETRIVMKMNWSKQHLLKLSKSQNVVSTHLLLVVSIVGSSLHLLRDVSSGARACHHERAA